MLLGFLCLIDPDNGLTTQRVAWAEVMLGMPRRRSTRTGSSTTSDGRASGTGCTTLAKLDASPINHSLGKAGSAQLIARMRDGGTALSGVIMQFYVDIDGPDNGRLAGTADAGTDGTAVLDLAGRGTLIPLQSHWRVSYTGVANNTINGRAHCGVDADAVYMVVP